MMTRHFDVLGSICLVTKTIEETRSQGDDLE
jgi:hypothetical protein